MLHFLETTFVLERRTIVASTLQYRSRNSAIQRRAEDVGVMLIVLLLTVLATSLVQAQTFTTLYSFAGASGEYPVAGLIVDAAGNLYGTTQQGGAHGLGTIFKVDSTGTETVLHSFKGGKSDGAFPSAGLAVDSKGNVYGTTTLGGRSNHGTVFKVTATATVWSIASPEPRGMEPIPSQV